MKAELIQKAEQLFTKCDVCMVASVSEQGYPRICVLMPLETNGIKEFWFSTGANGTKVRHFKNNKKSGVTRSEPQGNHFNGKLTVYPRKASLEVRPARRRAVLPAYPRDFPR